ncbi:MAG: flagellar export protein FliJ [Marmoricola sp.]
MSAAPSRRHPDDAGLHAVSRVRSVREQDSRSGLQQANQELAQATAQVEALEASVRRAADAAPAATADAWVAARATLVALSSRISAAREGASMSRTVAEAALARWQSDRARLEAVELLLERRAAERRTERARSEARELDDLAAQRHLRALRGDA